MVKVQEVEVKAQEMEEERVKVELQEKELVRKLEERKVLVSSNMDKKEMQYWINYFARTIRYSNRIGSHANCIRVFKNNTYLHEKTKFDICWKLMRNGYTIFTECIFTDGGRADIVAINDKNAWIVEVETKKSPKEMAKKLAQKDNYPDIFDLVVIIAEDFDIDKWEL